MSCHAAATGCNRMPRTRRRNTMVIQEGSIPLAVPGRQALWTSDEAKGFCKAIKLPSMERFYLYHVQLSCVLHHVMVLHHSSCQIVMHHAWSPHGSQCLGYWRCHQMQNLCNFGHENLLRNPKSEWHTRTNIKRTNNPSPTSQLPITL